jgi:chromosome segregation ATPase
METIVEGTAYTSRPKLLLDFFKRSRDKWKQKCKQAKAELKLAKNQNRAVEKSRANWRSRAKELKAEVERLQQELEDQKGRCP